VLDDESVALAASHPANAERMTQIFTTTFDFVAAHGADKVFRRWDEARGEFKGSFLSTAFEVFALGIGYHVASGTPYSQDLLAIVKQFWNRPEMAGGFATGRSTERRLVEFVPLGRTITAPH
jgi:hypothetical protein